MRQLKASTSSDKLWCSETQPVGLCPDPTEVPSTVMDSAADATLHYGDESLLLLRADGGSSNRPLVSSSCCGSLSCIGPTPAEAASGTAASFLNPVGTAAAGDAGLPASTTSTSPDDLKDPNDGYTSKHCCVTQEALQEAEDLDGASLSAWSISR